MLTSAFDEMNGPPVGGGGVRAAYEGLNRWLKETPAATFDTRRSQAELVLPPGRHHFAVYGDNEASERLIPFDVIPRVLVKSEWDFLERGLTQRVTALNAFLADIYGPQECIRAGVVPADLIYQNPNYRLEMRGVEGSPRHLRPDRRHRRRPGRRA